MAATDVLKTGGPKLVPFMTSSTPPAVGTDAGGSGSPPPGAHSGCSTDAGPRAVPAPATATGGAASSAEPGDAGGLSGAPVRRRSTEIVAYIARATAGKLPIIGVGGITDVIGAAEKLDAGAALVQVYTGMIYRGPFFAAELARGLAARDAR